MASVYPTPHTNAERIWLSSGRVPLHTIYWSTDFIKFSVWSFGTGGKGQEDYKRGEGDVAI